MSTINERFELIIERICGKNKSAFAKTVGVAPSVLENVVGKRQGKPSFDFISAVCEKIPVSADWLLTGRGPMLKEEASESAPLPTARPAQSPVEGIPLIPESAMAGALSGDITVLEYECERYVVPAFRDAHFLVSVKGDSMTPTYHSGDIVACRRVSLSDLFFQWGRVYVLDTDQGVIIKRVRPIESPEASGAPQASSASVPFGSTTAPVPSVAMPSRPSSATVPCASATVPCASATVPCASAQGAPCIRIVSDNPDYDPFALPVSSVRHIALVIGIIRLE